MEGKELTQFLLKNIENIQGQWKKELTPSTEEALEYYEADELDLGESKKQGKNKKNVSKYVEATLSNTIDWAMTYFMAVFAGREDIFKVNPREKEDVEAANMSEKLLSYQLFSRNKWYEFVWDIIFDSLLNKIGVAKSQYYKEVKNIDVVKENISEEELSLILSDQKAQLISQEIVSETPNITGTDPMTGMPLITVSRTYNATIRYSDIDEYNLVEALPHGSIGFDLSTRNIDDLDFFFHRSDLKPFQIKKKYGVDAWTRIEQMADQLKTGSYDYETKEFKSLGGYQFVTTQGKESIKDGPFHCYECCYIDPDTGSYMIANIIGEELLEPPVINKYGRIPIRVATPQRMPHKIVGRGLHQKLKMLQRISTALMRQLLNNLYYHNEGRFIISRDANLDVDSFENNNGPGSYVFVDGDVQAAITQTVPPPLHPWAFSLIERVQSEIEYLSGVPRAFKGIDTSELNKTFRGQQQQIKQASQILESMARSYAETFFIPLIKDCNDNNIKFLSKTQSFRIANKYYQANQDNLIGDYDFTCNFGIGVENKDQVIMRLQQLLSIYGQLKKFNVPVVTAQNVYHVMGIMVDAMGYKDTDNFVTDPKVIESVQQLLVIVIQHMQMMGVIDPQLMQAVQMVAQNIGMMMPQEQQKNEPNDQKTNIEQPKQMAQPSQPMNPVTSLDGNNNFG